jgi:hypothetical protein
MKTIKWSLFTEWLRAQPMERMFVYTDCLHCTVASFVLECGGVGITKPSVDPLDVFDGFHKGAPKWQIPKPIVELLSDVRVNAPTYIYRKHFTVRDLLAIIDATPGWTPIEQEQKPTVNALELPFGNLSDNFDGSAMVRGCRVQTMVPASNGQAAIISKQGADSGNASGKAAGAAIVASPSKDSPAVVSFFSHASTCSQCSADITRACPDGYALLCRDAMRAEREAVI